MNISELSDREMRLVGEDRYMRANAKRLRWYTPLYLFLMSTFFGWPWAFLALVGFIPLYIRMKGQTQAGKKFLKENGR